MEGSFNSEGLRFQVHGLAVAQHDAQDGISVIGVAERALAEVHSILHRQRDLAIQAGNDSNNAASRAAIKTEPDALADIMTHISEATNFNGIKLLDPVAGSVATGGMTFQIGPGGVAGEDRVDVLLFNVTAVGAATKAQGFDTPAAALASVKALDDQITFVSEALSGLGAAKNRLESARKSLAVSRENLGAAESRIRDTDMAEEMVRFTKSNILSQAGMSMMAQANQSNQGVLSLLGYASSAHKGHRCGPNPVAFSLPKKYFLRLLTSPMPRPYGDVTAHGRAEARH